MEHASSNYFSLTDPHLLPAFDSLAQQICIDICQSNEMHGKSGSVALESELPQNSPSGRLPGHFQEKKKRSASVPRRVQKGSDGLRNCSGARWLTLRSHLHTCTQDSDKRRRQRRRELLTHTSRVVSEQRQCIDNLQGTSPKSASRAHSRNKNCRPRQFVLLVGRLLIEMEMMAVS